MKQQKLKNYLKIGILAFGISLFFQSCNRDEIIDYQEFKKNNVIVEPVSLIELESNPLFGNILSNKTSKIDIYKSKSSTTSKNADNDYTILTNEISRATYRDYEAYSFRIRNPNQPLFTFDNYVIQKNHDGTIEEFILRYKYDQLEFVKSKAKKFLSISKYDTNYNFISSDKEFPGKVSSKNSLSSKSSSGEDCIITTKIYHIIPDGRKYEFMEGSVCQHQGECTIIVEYTITCNTSGGGGTGSESGGSEPDGTAPTGGGTESPDNGGTSTPITMLQPVDGEVSDTNTIDILTDIIEAPLSIIPSENEIIHKNSALIAYLMESNQPIFQDLSIVLASNVYDSTLNVNDRVALWNKSKAIYNIIKNNNPTAYYRNFDVFFSSLDAQEQEGYTKNTMETALFSSVKSLVDQYWPKNADEWGVLFNLMKPLLLEIGIEFLPGGGVFNAGKDTLAGLSSGDYTTAVIGVVGIIMEFVPWAKLAKIATKIYDVGKSAFKIFKVAYNFLASIATAIENGIKTVLDSSGILKLIDNSGNQVGRIVDNILTFKYTGFGGDIVTNPSKTTTVIGRFNDAIHGGGISKIKESGLYNYGENIGGINILDAPPGTWTEQLNLDWLNDAIQRNDVIRVVSDPLDDRNLFRVDSFGNITSELTPFGLEVNRLNLAGYTFNPNTFEFTP